MKIKDNRNPKDYSRYEYFRILKGIGPAIPVRIVYDDEGLQIGADTIDAKNGVLIKRCGITCEAEESPYSNDSTEEEFWDLCRQHVEYEKNKAK